MKPCTKCGLTQPLSRGRNYCVECFREQCRLNARKYYEARKRPCACGGWIINITAKRCQTCENKSRPVKNLKTRKGQKWTDTQRYSMSAENHYLYKGGIQYDLHKIRGSEEYSRWRGAVFARDDYTCQGCGERGCYLEADHELPFSLYPDLRFEVLNGRTFCKPCHYKYGWNIFREANPRKRDPEPSPTNYAAAIAKATGLSTSSHMVELLT